MRIGSLCTGIAGLELGLRYAGVNTEPVFVSDIDPGANQWLAATMPDVPNLGDFTAYDELPEVDLITAGFPCQPFSTAGNRQGLTDERYLFDDIARLTGRMGTRPLLFLENVPGLLTANDGNAVGRVVHELAAIGYHITWGTLSATAVGAPHRRLRWWGLAWHTDNSKLADADSARRKDERIAVKSEQDHAGFGSDCDVPADTACVGKRSETRPQQTPQQRLADGTLGCSSPAADAGALAGTREQGRRQPHETDRSGHGGQPSPSHSAGSERRGPKQQHLPSPTGPAAEPRERARALTERFGPYAGAIGRWECVLGRTAPDPTFDGRLSPAFVEWMMGYPAGWVTDTLTTRNHALKALGNAVVPQCAAEAFTQLHNRIWQHWVCE